MRLTALVTLCLFSTLTTARAGQLPLAPDAPLDAVLDALDARGKNLEDFSADVALHTTDQRTGQDTAQIGTIVFQNRDAAASRIRVKFEKKVVDDGNGPKITQQQRLDYVLEGGWLTDRDYQKKLEVRRQVLKPGQQMNLLKLGEGPFPLPIGQDKAEVKKQFKPERIASGEGDPPNTIHVRLTPNKGSQFERKFKQIDVFVDRNTAMPVRIDTVEPAGTTRSTELTNVKLNGGVKDEAFALPNIDNQGWNRREEPFQ
jgi:outer membrane lipoprotein-sorting protein